MRLTAAFRHDISCALVKGFEADKQEALEQKEWQLAEDIYRDRLGEQYDVIQHSPEHWFEQETSIEVHLGQYYTSLGFGPDEREEDGYKFYPIPAGYTPEFGVYSASHPFSKRYNTIQSARKDIRKRRIEAEAEIASVLHSVTTVGKLCKIWPTAVHIINKVTSQPDLPTGPVNPETLDKKLGLE